MRLLARLLLLCPSVSCGAAGAKTASPIDLRSAGQYVILAGAQISTAPPSTVTGDLGLSPAAASALTGFSLTPDVTHAFATAPQVTGRLYAADDAAPIPAELTAAMADMETAFADGAARTPEVTGLGAGNIGGLTLAAGVYRWTGNLQISTDVHLSGSATDVWVFEIGQDLTLSDSVGVFVSDGALARNVFWVVSGGATLGALAHLEGVLLSQASISLGTEACVNGRLLAQSAVSLSSSLVIQPLP